MMAMVVATTATPADAVVLAADDVVKAFVAFANKKKTDDEFDRRTTTRLA